MKCPHTRYVVRAIASFAVAVDRRFQKDKEREVDFFNVTAWQHTAEFVCRNFTKGQPIAIDGRLQLRKWKDETGTTHYAVEVVAESVHFAGFKRENGAGDAGYAPDFNPFEGMDDELPVAA